MQQAILAAGSQIESPEALHIGVKHSAGYSERFTSIDTAISSLLLQRAREVFPQSYSEEDLPESPLTDKYFWQIDPLDGTDELIEGRLPFCGVSAALHKLRVDGQYEPIAGLLYLPAPEVMVVGDTANNHLAITRKGRDCRIRERDRSRVRGYVRECDPNDEVKAYYHALGTKFGIRSESINCGGAVHAFVSLILDEINVLCFNYGYSKEWDVSAAEPILKLLGGFLCDLDGAPFTYNREDFLNRRGFLASISFAQNELMQTEAKLALSKKHR
jgi:3'-phosphoadenosine 5'-phosphosulfate (PAPS) 3'-phosphatase